MSIKKEYAGAAPTAPASIARLVSQATHFYPVACVGSTGLAAYLVGLRFGISPSLAPTLAELAGYGGQA